jgi:hypothetical protein
MATRVAGRPRGRNARTAKDVDDRFQRGCVVSETLTTFTDPLFRSMADGLQGLERAPGPGRR